ncbi:MAG: glucodextranase DOMON-like domain-containing protein [Elusimicrobiota bacterium]
MKTHALLLAVVLTVSWAGFPPAAAGFWGWPSEEASGVQKAPGREALLWVPDEGATDFDELRTTLEKYPKARLTIALAPNEIPESARPWLVEHVGSGRLEVALRIPGDPILPLVHAERPQGVTERLAIGRSLYREIFGRLPEGFVPGGGALTPAHAEPLAEQGFKWTTAGDAAFARPWYAHDDLRIVPFHVIESTGPDSLPPPDDTPAVALDEASAGIPAGSGTALLSRMFESAGQDRWTTVASALESARPYAVGPDPWPTWSGDLSRWDGDPLQRQAWSLYRRTAEALKRYQNSGTAQLQTLNRAATELRAAQDSRYYLVESLEDPATEGEFRGRLRKVFSTIRQLVPKVLRVPVAKSAPGQSPPETEPGEQGPAEPEAPGEGEDYGRVSSSAEGATLSFENPEGSVASVPEPLPDLADGTTAQDLWTPRRLRVEWNDEAVVFAVAMARLEPSDEAPNGFSRLLLDLYMDLNRLAGRGSTKLLPGRKGYIRSRDAWEFALVLNGWSAGLYRSVPGHPPVLAERLEPEADLELGEIRVSVPRTRLRGSPSTWGYLLAAMATDQDLAREVLPRPLDAGEGNPVLGLLGSLEDQARLTRRGPPAYRRFSALRLKPLQ